MDIITFKDFYNNTVQLSFSDHPFSETPKHVWCLCKFKDQWLLTEHPRRGIEFPGGKVEEGETKESALIREIREELDIDIQITKEFITVDHEYPDFKLTMHSFLCTSDSRELDLKEHVAFQWLSKKDLINLDWAAADVPIVKQLIEQ